MDRLMRHFPAFGLWLFAAPIWAEVPAFELVLKDHLFYPAKVEVPSGQKVRLIIHNQDDTPEEFDSFDLNREKVVFPQRKATIYIGPLKPGTYEFFGEFNPHTARGEVIAVEVKDAD
ncbi:cupredoxin domain-containing protein [Aliiglaciecola sp. CAU 1673]|uniref:cupredoxin domain-containing protein n=1 Tax=Aliiglaciecola sp. CAU 1673 TaxID=3032595 RepID=UPI0023DCD694|nr:cupredoxin domain-containing protein [Aliiglaciecola sp. CAU 1673]MDF2177267.1 cupredoxin domain-containing protein [Aliiglaciecola sp. CAU 1673]